MPSPSRRRTRSALRVLAALLLATLAGPAGDALAHGGPSKLVERRFVVTATLWPTGDATRLRFFFRDFRSGRVPVEPLSFRVRILADRSRAVIYEGAGGRVEDGRVDVLFRAPDEGFYEVFLQFWSDGDPTHVYEPDDWRVWIGEPGSPRPWGSIAVVATAAVGMAMIGVATWRRRADGSEGRASCRRGERMRKLLASVSNPT
jgi:hypothetical protein